LPPLQEPDIGRKLDQGMSTLIWGLIKVSRERGDLDIMGINGIGFGKQ
jgi:hypothetical protein